MKQTTAKTRSLVQKVLLFGARAGVLGLIAWGLFAALDYARHSPQALHHFRIQHIDYRGLLNLDQNALDGLIREKAPANLLLVDLDQVRGLVESQAWVRQAAVRRKLPGRLVVEVVERRPAAVAALDNELYVVDAEGILLDRYGPRYQHLDRPIVKGLQNVARENARQENAARMQVYLKVVEELAPYHQSISEIDVEDRQRVAVIPQDDSVQICLGSEHFLQRYETFVSQRELYERLKKQYGTIESVDVTYDNKIIFHTPQQKEGVTAKM